MSAAPVISPSVDALLIAQVRKINALEEKRRQAQRSAGDMDQGYKGFVAANEAVANLRGEVELELWSLKGLLEMFYGIKEPT